MIDLVQNMSQLTVERHQSGLAILTVESLSKFPFNLDKDMDLNLSIQG